MAKRLQPDNSGYAGDWADNGNVRAMNGNAVVDYLLRKPIFTSGVGDISETSGLYNSSKNVTILPLEMRSDYGVQQLTTNSKDLNAAISLSMFKVGYSCYINLLITLPTDMQDRISGVVPANTGGVLVFPKGWGWKVMRSMELSFPSTNVNANTYPTTTMFMHALLTSRDVQKDLVLGMGGKQLTFVQGVPHNYTLNDLTCCIILPLPWTQMNPVGAVPVDTEVFPSAPSFTFNTNGYNTGLCWGSALDTSKYTVNFTSYNTILAQAQTVTLSSAQSSIGKELRMETQRGNYGMGGLIYPFLNPTSNKLSPQDTSECTFRLGTLLNADIVRICAFLSKVGNIGGSTIGQGETFLFEDNFKTVELQFNSNPYFRFSRGQYMNATLPYYGRDEGFTVYARTNPAEYGVNPPSGGAYAIQPVRSGFFSFSFSKENAFRNVHALQNVPRYFGQEFTIKIEEAFVGQIAAEPIGMEVINYYVASYVLDGQNTQLLMSGYVRQDAIPQH